MGLLTKQFVGFEQGECDEAEEDGVKLVKARCDALVFLDAAEKSFDEMSPLVSFSIKDIRWAGIRISPDIKAPSGNDGLGALLLDHLADICCIIPFISDHVGDGRPRPGLADALKALAILSLGGKKLAIDDGVLADCHVDCCAQTLASSANGWRALIFLKHRIHAGAAGREIHQRTQRR